MKFTKAEIEIITGIGKPKPDRPLTEHDDPESLLKDIQRIRYEVEVENRYFVWLSSVNKVLASIDDDLYSRSRSSWAESNEILNRFKR